MNSHECTCQYCIEKRNHEAEVNPYYYKWIAVSNQLYFVERVAAAGWILLLLAMVALWIASS